MKTLDDARKVTPAELTTMTEPQVDEHFAAVGDEYYRLSRKLRSAETQARRAVGDKQIHGVGWKMSWSEAEKLIASATYADAVRAREYRAEVQKEIRDLDDTVWAKLTAEFDRRGGWTRAFLVTDGHVHKTRQCSTCNKGEYPTEFSWMIDYSGKTEAEIVEAADERACTVCYPSAPVAKKVGKPDLSKSKMFTPEEKERAAAREEAARKKAEKAAKAALNAITQPNGEPLRNEVGKDGVQTRSGNLVRTLTTARIELKSELYYKFLWGDERGERERNARHLARAVAWKIAGLPVGTEPTEEQVTAVLEEFRAKAKKDYDKG
jgi:hypothetical protein